MHSDQSSNNVIATVVQSRTNSSNDRKFYINGKPFELPTLEMEEQDELVGVDYLALYDWIQNNADTLLIALLRSSNRVAVQHMILKQMANVD